MSAVRQAPDDLKIATLLNLVQDRITGARVDSVSSMPDA